MPKFSKIKELEELASKVVGDGHGPDLFFVSVEGVVVTVTRNFELAYREWQKYSWKCEVETALENRTYGVICDVSPVSDEDKQLRFYDASKDYLMEKSPA